MCLFIIDIYKRKLERFRFIPDIRYISYILVTDSVLSMSTINIPQNDAGTESQLIDVTSVTIVYLCNVERTVVEN